MADANKYRFDPNYRQKAIDRAKSNHHKWMQYKVYRELRKVRVAICNYKDSIQDAENKIRSYRGKLKLAMYQKEELELEFGRLRARLKKEAKHESNRSRTLI